MLQTISTLAFMLWLLQYYECESHAGEVASKTSLRLTRKKNVFMAGFPVKALSEWQRTLVEAGFQLAVCTQATPQ